MIQAETRIVVPLGGVLEKGKNFMNRKGGIFMGLNTLKKFL